MNNILREISQACRKCGAASGEYCRHSNVTKAQAKIYEQFDLSENSLKAINRWLKEMK